MVTLNPKTKRISFKISIPEANTVKLVGDFNNWDDSSHPMKKNKNGTWQIKLKLQEGEYQFLYLVDDSSWKTDDEMPTVKNEFGSENSIVKVQY
ncbi:MAG: hypothetical protein GWN01_09140 [Nitrosopumilaceae archaeon]|nr:hypothetical protein [Nitrosopumilaceae archaeon]NIU87513.1 hypothetical protein [Nitrosopumilaceae archaeon]NIV65976.1 hypothetical protein [Nitrosopumilaceae archaeon]NIX61672.1 hypothetical protein [Nitrosopumilaceae archaeon]